ncbi:MAG: EAL domain-containing protein [Ancalomicrobiaceae bacterium]|nr:EAL domain-containing protein [Ancalomicrobiaceae bacterium]
MSFLLRSTYRSRIWPVWTSLGYFVPAMLALVMLLYAAVRIDIDKRQQFHDNLRASIVRDLGKIGTRLQGNIEGDIELVHGLVAVVAAEPQIDQKHFAEIAEQVFKVKSQLRNIAAAPDMIIRLIYPVEPNVRSLGFDVRKSDTQRAAALKARDTGSMVMTGPVNLVQGGIGLIARYPVFTKTAEGANRFWGLVSAVMDLDMLYVDSGLNDDGSPIDVAITRISADGQTDTFFGNPSVLDKDPVTFQLAFGDGAWVLSAVPKAGWMAMQADDVRWSRLMSFGILLLVVGPLAWAGYLMKQRHRIIVDLGEREERLERLSHRLQLALDASKIGVWEYDPATGEMMWDARMREIYGIPPAKLKCTYADWRRALHPADRDEAERVFKRALANASQYITEFRIVTPAGTVEHIRAHGAVYWWGGRTKRIVGANWNVTRDVLLKEELRTSHLYSEIQNRQLEEASRTLAYQSIHDALTGLPNRRYLDQYLDQHPQVDRFAILHVDLDRFKSVNDTYGHAVGDEVLKVAAQRLKSQLLEAEFVARMGGDEFVIAAPARDPEARSRALAAAILEAFTDPIHVGALEFRVGSSVGIAVGTGSSETRQLLVQADLALYEAKKLGRNRVEFFSESMRQAHRQSKKLADEILRAIENVEFVPFFQPQFDAKTLEVVGAEALVRWNHPKRGLLTPDKFLPQAQSLNAVAEIDAIVLDKSLFEFTRWRAQGFDVPKISVNISAQRLRDRRLIERLSHLVLAPGTLSFELLESISFDDDDAALMGAIHKIKEFGIDIEIDDFGSGHASILSLLKLAPRRLKIDRKLVAPIVDSEQQRRLVASIVDIGRSVGVEIIAEGVETMVHAQVLRDLGCQVLQGYAFAPAMPSKDFQEFLLRRQTEARREVG